MIFILGLAVGAALAGGFFWIGYQYGVWASGPPAGFDLIMIPKTTHLIFETDGCRVVHNPLWNKR